MYSKTPLEDLTGKKFGALTVLRYSHRVNYYHHWVCQCDCGKIKTVGDPSARYSEHVVRSCGCLRYAYVGKALKEKATKHGHARSTTTSPEYRTWSGAKNRCHNPNNRYWAHYGGAGIKMCDEWRHSFETFLADMGERPSSEHSLDRIDSTKDYCKENCRWVPMLVQQRNTKDGLIYAYKGKLYRPWELAELLGCERADLKNSRRLPAGVGFVAQGDDAKMARIAAVAAE